MTTIDRHLLKELIKFVSLALLSVVIIYLLIDLFEELSYFTSRKVSFWVILQYYFYSLPSAIVLLYPVSLILAVFVVYGQLTRNNELSAFKSSGVIIYRLFGPAVFIGIVSIFIYLIGNEWITIPFNRQLTDLRRLTIEKRSPPSTQRLQDIYRVDGNIVFWSKELEKPMGEKNNGSSLRNFLLIELNKSRQVVYRIDGERAEYQDSIWIGENIKIRKFIPSGEEDFLQANQKDLVILGGLLEETGINGRPIDEISTSVLRKFIKKMKNNGENVAREELEYHYRFSYSLIGLIMVLLGLPLSVRRLRGGVMLGLGLGLLFSFLYWGVIQTFRAFGTSHVVIPIAAAWIPNIIFAGVALILFIKVAI